MDLSKRARTSSPPSNDAQLPFPLLPWVLHKHAFSFLFLCEHARFATVSKSMASCVQQLMRTTTRPDLGTFRTVVTEAATSSLIGLLRQITLHTTDLVLDGWPVSRHKMGIIRLECENCGHVGHSETNNNCPNYGKPEARPLWQQVRDMNWPKLRFFSWQHAYDSSTQELAQLIMAPTLKSVEHWVVRRLVVHQLFFVNSRYGFDHKIVQACQKYLRGRRGLLMNGHVLDQTSDSMIAHRRKVTHIVLGHADDGTSTSTRSVQWYNGTSRDFGSMPCHWRANCQNPGCELKMVLHDNVDPQKGVFCIECRRTLCSVCSKIPVDGVRGCECCLSTIDVCADCVPNKSLQALRSFRCGRGKQL